MESGDAVREHALSLGFATVGIAPADASLHNEAYDAWIAAGMAAEMDYLARHADAKRSVTSLLPGARSVIAVTLNYLQDPLPGPHRVARYAIGRDYHRVIESRLRSLGQFVESRHPNSAWRAAVDTAPILEREWANQAGLGWFGKNTMLIDSRRGSWFFIGILLTEVEFRPDTPTIGGCGSCRACIDACPTGAIVQRNGRWQVDARSCISYATIEQRTPLTAAQENGLGHWTFGCDVCQEVCPFNQPRSSQPLRAQPTEVADFRHPHPAAVAVAGGEGIPDWDLVSRGSPLRRSHYLRRKFGVV